MKNGKNKIRKSAVILAAVLLTTAAPVCAQTVHAADKLIEEIAVSVQQEIDKSTELSVPARIAEQIRNLIAQGL